jgi:hypothetical protein
LNALTNTWEFNVCGIVGAIGTLKVEDEKAFTQLLTINALRGVDSTGVFTINTAETVSVAKQVGNPYELMSMKVFDKALQGMQRVMVGHNRYATQGAVSKRNAHPFEFENLIGVHNGTLRNKWQLKDAKDFSVDSENLYHVISEEGLTSALSNLDGAWALVWWDKVLDKLHILRNKERPLYYVETESKNVYFASEGWMLEGVLSRNNIKIKAPPMLFDEDYLHTFNIDLKTGSILKVEKRLAKSGFKSCKTATTFTPTVVTSPPPPVQETKGKKFFFEVLNHTVDQFNQNYFDLYCEQYPNDDLRYYYAHLEGNPLDYVGEFFSAELTNIPILCKDGRYYRVFSYSVEWIDLPKEKHVCAWCSMDVDLKKEHGKTNSGDYICNDCVNDPQLKDYLDFNLVTR